MDGHIFVSESGVQIRIKQVSNFLMLQAQNNIQMPKVPTVWLEDKGREEENPNDPDYLLAVQEAQIKRSIMVTDLYLGFGATIVYPLPSGIDNVDDLEWAEDIAAVTGMEIPTNKRLRQALWLKAIVLQDKEVGELLNCIVSLSGLVKEESVAEAEDTFQPEEGRNTTESVPA